MGFKTINDKNITFVFQGSINESVGENITKVRLHFPASKIILSTWEHEEISGDIQVDKVVRSPDPGPLPGIKKNDIRFNNGNRQIVSTYAGLSHVDTEYVVKIRTDMTMQSRSMIKSIVEMSKYVSDLDRIYVPTLFSLSGNVFERLTYHISDWIQFGSIKKMRKLWSVGKITSNDAIWYDHHKVPEYYNFYERFFRSRFAVEQHIYMNYARLLGYNIPSELVDLESSVLLSFRDFVRDELVVLDPVQFGYYFDKYPNIENEPFHKLNCISNSDWVWFNQRCLGNKLLFLIMTPNYINRLISKKINSLIASSYQQHISTLSYKGKVKMLVKAFIRR